MGPVERTWSEVEAAGRASARRPAARALFRAGYFARGVVYAVMGLVALRVALGGGGRTTDSKGAVATLADAPVGGALVAALAVGLVGLALWNVVQGIADPDGTRRSGAWAVASRAGQVLAGLAYASLAYAAVRLAFGEGAGPMGDAAARSWTGRALSLPGGRALVLAGGALAVFVGARQIWIGVRRRFLAHLGAMSPPVERLARQTGTAGFATQGTVFALVGLFFAQAAFERDPREATGFDGALEVIARQPLGMALLALASLGLLAYAVFSFIEGRHRRMRAR
jgi:hypothetical protein